MNVFRVFGHEVVIDSDILYEALNVLPEINREILLLHEYLRMSDDEISKKVSMCRSTVRNKRIDALKELRGKLCLSCSQEI
jgi:DNA-directed RNA polymerase specialized sigma24 family protein